MPAAPRRRPGEKSADSVPTSASRPSLPSRPVFVVAVLVLLRLCAGASGNDTSPAVPRNATNKVLQIHEPRTPGRTYELVSTSASHEKNKHDESKVADDVPSSELSAATKQYDYSLLRPYGPIITAYTARPPAPTWPSVEILNNHQNPPFVNAPFVTSKPSQHVMGNPLLSTVVVQDMSQSSISRPAIVLDSGEPAVSNVHQLGATKIPFTNVQVVTKPLYGKPAGESDLSFTDKLEESELSDESANDEEDGDDTELLENPPHLDMGGIVEDALKDVFKSKKVLKTTKEMLPGPEDMPTVPWSCPPVTCCTKASKASRRKCASVVSCKPDGRPQCPGRLPELLPSPQALTVAAQPDGGNSTEKADLRDGEPRFKKKKIVKKKKKFLKKFMLPLLLAYKLLFMLLVPLLVNGMMMMMSSSGMAGFFFALIGASVAMVRVYTGSMRVIPESAPHKVVKVVKYVQAPPAPPPPPPPPVFIPTTTPPPPPPTIPPTTTPTTTVVYHQPYVEDHFPTYHAPQHPPMPPHPPPYGGSYFPHPYMTRYYDRSGAFEGGRRKRRRRKDSLLLGQLGLPDTTSDSDNLATLSQPDYWLLE